MDKDNNNGVDRQAKEQKPSDESTPEYREIGEDELKQILNEHKKWVKSDGKEGKQADLQSANLQYYNLNGAILQKANLKEANLQKANLSSANLQKAILRGAKLQKANLSGANLQKTFLYKADLEKAILNEASMIKANLYSANLKKAKLHRANLHKAILDRANLQKTLFTRANLQKAILDGTKLQKANLSNAILQKAFLYRAYLKKANFFESNLQKAYLMDANLSHANFYKAEMQSSALNVVIGLNEANLQYANLEGATGLLGNEFAQADVTGTRLPDEIKEFKALDIVKETSQNARKIFFAMLLGCVYSWLTTATTTDVRLLTNTASSPLPIIGTEIPIAGFYWAAPLVLICLYFYFHLYLLKLWEGLSGLPAIFPDGKRLDEIAYPWLLNGLVRKHFRLLKSGRPFIAHIQEWITIFLAWWVVPITMIAFWLRYIPRHDWIGTIFHIGLIVVSVAFAIIFYRMCALTLKGNDKKIFQLKNFWGDRRFYYGISIVLVFIIFTLVSYGTIEGEKKWYWYDRYEEDRKPKIPFVKEKLPKFFEKFGYSVFANFIEKEISNKPSNYYEIKKEERLESVDGADLSKANLNNADMYKAFMVNANLSNSFINNAHLLNANLEKAILKKAELKGSFLQEANLQNAILEYANLSETIFVNANLYNSIIRDSILQEAKLFWSNFEKANLMRANLKGADILGTNFQEAILENADLQEANLNGANLHKAKVQDANFYNTVFFDVDLTGAKNLTIDQLSKAKSLYQAKLDPELLEQVKKCCPHLLEKPKDEN
jgi:uncharacterized protein YjbI with pentapeptide repeats